MRDYYVQLIKQEKGMRSAVLRGPLPSIIDYFNKDIEPLTESGLLVIIIGFNENDEFNIVNDHILTVENFCKTYKDRTTHFYELDTAYKLDEALS